MAVVVAVGVGGGVVVVAVGVGGGVVVVAIGVGVGVVGGVVVVVVIVTAVAVLGLSAAHERPTAARVVLSRIALVEDPAAGFGKLNCQKLRAGIERPSYISQQCNGPGKLVGVVRSALHCHSRNRLRSSSAASQKWQG